MLAHIRTTYYAEFGKEPSREEVHLRTEASVLWTSSPKLEKTYCENGLCAKLLEGSKIKMCLRYANFLACTIVVR